MVSSPFFKSKMHLDYAAYQVSSMTTFHQYDMLLPSGVKYLFVGCLGSLLVELRQNQGETREVAVSKYFLCLVLGPLQIAVSLPERMMMAFSDALTSILNARPDVRIMIMRPTLRSTPGTFKNDLVLIQVFEQDFLQGWGLPWLISVSLSSFQPFLGAFDRNELKIRVLPHFPMDAKMLRVDGESLNSETTVNFLSFLASQISDLVAYFTSRDERSRGQVTLDENSNEGTGPPGIPSDPNGAPPAPPGDGQVTPAGSGSGSFGPWNFPEWYSTPNADRPVPPVSGVSS
jgi:hypothetical protein